MADTTRRLARRRQAGEWWPVGELKTFPSQGTDDEWVIGRLQANGPVRIFRIGYDGGLLPIGEFTDEAEGALFADDAGAT